VSYEGEMMAKQIKKLHEQIRAYIEKINEVYKAIANRNRKRMAF